MATFGSDGLLSVELTYGHWFSIMRMIDRLADCMTNDERAAALILALQVQADIRDAMFAAGDRLRAH